MNEQPMLFGDEPQPLIPPNPTAPLGTVYLVLDEQQETYAKEVADYVASRKERTNAWNRIPGSDRYRSSWDGFRGELSFSVAADVPWHPIRKTYREYLEPDVAGCDVRATTLTEGGLVIRKDDDVDDRPHVLVVIYGGSMGYGIIGWMYNGEAKAPQWKQRAARPGDDWWLVPQYALRDLWKLPIDRSESR